MFDACLICVVKECVWSRNGECTKNAVIMQKRRNRGEGGAGRKRKDGEKKEKEAGKEERIEYTRVTARPNHTGCGFSLIKKK